MSEIAKFIQSLPQIVPEDWCLRCKICCRFPDTKGVQTPTWSSLESGWALKAGGYGSWFQQVKESNSLVPILHSCGNGFLCPAFHAGDNRCSIYSVRPLDCRLYPFVLTKNPGGTEVLLAVDTKCPYIQEHLRDSKVLAYANTLAHSLETPVALDYLNINPQIIGDSWPEFITMAALPSMTATLQMDASPPHPALRPLKESDRSLLEEALKLTSHVYSGYTVASVFGWSDLIRYWWTSFEGAFCLFAQHGGGLFMPLPPLGKNLRPEVYDAAWEILSEANHGNQVSRIEGIEPSAIHRQLLREFYSAQGDSEYLYRRADLTALQGNRYRSQRGALNRFRRQISTPCFRPFQTQDLISCLQLYTLWGIQRQQTNPDLFSKALVRDGLFFHRRLMMSCHELGLTGRVLEGNGKIIGYTFGAPVSPRSFCVFLEIGDFSIPGVNQVLFREFCREMDTFSLINAMGDNGFSGLRRAKQAYRPVGMVKTMVVVKGRKSVELTGVEPATS